jgi:tryptophan 2,3-dioxygenase
MGTPTDSTARLTYGSYLQLDKLLDAQTLQSALAGRPAHDELLFIITHQTYELWFKQVLHELRAALAVLRADFVPDKQLGQALRSLERVVAIQKVLIEQISILETMTPLDFLDYRDVLGPSSGFQSYQFRAIENLLGLKREQRLTYNSAPYESMMQPHEQRFAVAPEKDVTLFDALDNWLARTPFVQSQDFDFWRAFSQRVDEMLRRDAAIIGGSPLLNDDARADQLRRLDATRAEFATVFDRAQYDALRAQGKRRLRFEAFLAALMISLYRDEPLFQTPFRLLTALINIDEQLMLWRHRHVLMVSRMIGTKIGTGGSSGVDYLQQTVSRHRVYSDLFNLSTYLIPRSQLPPLPERLQGELDFHYRGAQRG